MSNYDDDREHPDRITKSAAGPPTRRFQKDHGKKKGVKNIGYKDQKDIENCDSMSS